MYRETDSAPWANDAPWDFEEEELEDEDVDKLARADHAVAEADGDGCRRCAPGSANAIAGQTCVAW